MSHNQRFHPHMDPGFYSSVCKGGSLSRMSCECSSNLPSECVLFHAHMLQYIVINKYIRVDRFFVSKFKKLCVTRRFPWRHLLKRSRRRKKFLFLKIATYFV